MVVDLVDGQITSHEAGPKLENDLLFEEQSLFSCYNTIDTLKCQHCTNFETHKLVDLKQHFQAGHTLQESEEKLDECETCTFQTHSRYLFSRHKLLNLCVRNVKVKRNTFGKGILHKCKHCPFITNYPRNLENHTIAKHTDPDEIKWYHCELCPYKAKLQGRLRGHVRDTHDSEKRFKCPNCPFKTKFQGSLFNHMSFKHDSKKPFKCTNCSFETKLKYYLKMHIILMHTDPDKIEWRRCKLCPYKAKVKSYLSIHFKSVHCKEEKFKCDTCPYKTSSKRALKNHIKTHMDPDDIA